MSRKKDLAKFYDEEKRDARERVEALRLQATAWRQAAMIATADPQRGAKLAQWLLFHTMPFVDGDAVKKLIAETLDDATKCGTDSGVFTNPKSEVAALAN